MLNYIYNCTGQLDERYNDNNETNINYNTRIAYDFIKAVLQNIVLFYNNE